MSDVIVFAIYGIPALLVSGALGWAAAPYREFRLAAAILTPLAAWLVDALIVVVGTLVDLHNKIGFRDALISSFSGVLLLTPGFIVYLGIPTILACVVMQIARRLWGAQRDSFWKP